MTNCLVKICHGTETSHFRMGRCRIFIQDELIGLYHHISRIRQQVTCRVTVGASCIYAWRFISRNDPRGCKVWTLGQMWENLTSKGVCRHGFPGEGRNKVMKSGKLILLSSSWFFYSKSYLGYRVYLINNIFLKLNFFCYINSRFALMYISCAEFWREAVK